MTRTVHTRKSLRRPGSRRDGHRLSRMTVSGWLFGIVVLGLILNSYHLHWGLPGIWHPDTKVFLVLRMAGNADLNPHYFINPSLHLYLTAVLMAPYALALKLLGSVPVGIGSIFEAPESFITNVFVISRFLSVLMAGFCTLVVYLLGKRLRSEATGLFAALMFTVTLGVINLAHFATPETTLLFFVCLTCLFLFNIIEGGSRTDYALAGLAAGLAFSTKYTAVLLAAPMVTAHLWRHYSDLNPDDSRSPLRALMAHQFLLMPLLALAGFALTTPYAVLDFPAFWKDVMFNVKTQQTYRGFVFPDASWLAYLGHMKTMLGWPLAVMSAAGLVWGLYSGTKGHSGKHLVAVVWVLAFYAYLGKAHFSAMRFMIPVVPLLLLLSADMLGALVRRPGARRVMAGAVFGLVAVLSLGYCILGLSTFAHDSRYAARDWIAANVPAGTTIDFFAGYCPQPGECYPDSWYLPTNIDVRYPNLEYQVRFLPEIEDRSKSVAPLAARLRQEGGAYLVVVEDRFANYFKYPDAFPERREFYRRLLDGALGYTTVGEFKYSPPLVEVNMELVNPKIIILKRSL